MGLLPRWKSLVGGLVPPRYWRQAIELADRKTPASSIPMADLRVLQVEAFETGSLGFALKVQWVGNEARVYVDPRDSQRVTESLKSQGFVLVPIAKDSLDPAAIAGWSCATKSQVGARMDLVEAIGVRLLVIPGGRRPAKQSILDVLEPIDLVYTWVDGADETWQARRRESEACIEGELPPTANDAARYMSHDELRYSLRSVEAFLPWVNHIYVVTAGQRPDWLNEDHPGISVVDHEAIFEDLDALPTFNSHAIESQIHRIPNLSERFLYVNDDVFFGHLLGKQVFYTAAGYPKFALSEGRFDLEKTANLPVNIAAQNNNRLLESMFGKAAAHKFKHVAHAQLKSTLARIAVNHPIETQETARAKFRSENDLSIPSALAHYYGLALGAAYPGDVDYRYVDLASGDVHLKLTKLFFQKRPQMFCINEVSDELRDQIERTCVIHEILQRLFPWPSSFEMLGKQPK
ncbi:stealth family protein [Paeniglutamicibacter psychrophenolicus]|uniref:stealth family protein n=1 Tax=Paeniglutamicibacter psychrophenolicus TaxID=257454 RepID=UPI0027806569|nr:stealth family protein [Paeniglutamicibacter psychrophenolicus]MDQ0096134.1 hypothetical protein [Paeniglutamicibacter psychrophenolicus]